MRRIALAGLLAAAGFVSGCSAGGDGRSPDKPDADDPTSEVDQEFAAQRPADIMNAAHGAMISILSVHVIDRHEDGSIDLRVDRDGDCFIDLVNSEGRHIIQLVVGDDSWIKLDEISLRKVADSPAELRDLRRRISGRWMESSGELEASNTCDQDPFVNDIFSFAGLKGDYVLKGTGEVDGIPVVKIAYRRDGVRHLASIVADGSTPYLLRDEVTDGPGGGTAFLEIEGDFDVAAPAPEEIVDLDDL